MNKRMASITAIVVLLAPLASSAQRAPTLPERVRDLETRVEDLEGRTLVLVDGRKQIVGEVVSKSTERETFVVLIDLDGLPPIFLTATRTGFVRSIAIPGLYFEAPDCTGKPWMVAFSSESVVWAPGEPLFVGDFSAHETIIQPQSFRRAGGGCLDSVFLNLRVVPAIETPIIVDRFEPPFYVTTRNRLP